MWPPRFRLFPDGPDGRSRRLLPLPVEPGAAAPGLPGAGRRGVGWARRAADRPDLGPGRGAPAGGGRGAPPPHLALRPPSGSPHLLPVHAGQGVAGRRLRRLRRPQRGRRPDRRRGGGGPPGRFRGAAALGPGAAGGLASPSGASPLRRRRAGRRARKGVGRAARLGLRRGEGAPQR